MGTKMRRRTVYVATIVATLAMVGGWVLAASTTTVLPSQTSNVTSGAPSGFTAASVQSTQVVVESSTIVGYANGGTQLVGTSALGGTTTALAVCAAGPCTGNYNSVNGNAPTAGEYAVQMVLAVTQPATGGAATGFDVQVEANINANVLVFGYVYFSTGVSSAVSAQTVNVYVFVDLGVGVAPTVNSISIQMNGCLSATTCP